MTIGNYTIKPLSGRQEEDDWNNFTGGSDQMITIAHNPSLKNILETTFKFPTTNLQIRKGDNLVGIFPFSTVSKKVVSMPHFSYGDILFTGDPSDKKMIRDHLIGRSYEVRSFELFSPFADDSKVMCYLQLMPSEKEQWDFWKSKLRSQIRKGIKDGIEVKIGGIEFVDDFYSIYSRNMRDLGSPVLGYSFFKNLLKEYRHGEAKIFLAGNSNIRMAASIVLTYHDFAEVCWASSLKSYNKMNANIVMYWEMIKYTVNNEYKIFSFGRSSKDSNTLKFKKQWTPLEKQLYFNLPKQPEFNLKKYSFLSEIWKKLPLPVANSCGPYFAKKIY